MLWIFTIFFIWCKSTVSKMKWLSANLHSRYWSFDLSLKFLWVFCCFKPLTSVLLIGNQMDSHFPTILLQEPFYGKCLHYSITVHCPPCVSPGSFLLCAEHIRLKEGNESEPSDASVLSLSQFHDFVFPFEKVPRVFMFEPS